MKKLFLSAVVSVSSLYVSATTLDEARKLIQYKRYERVIDLLQKEVSERVIKDKQLPELYYLLGQAYIHKRKIDKAKKNYQEAMDRLPSSPIIMVGLGHTLLAGNLEQEAKPLFENALEQTKPKELIPIYTAILYAYGHTHYGNPEYILQKIKNIPEKLEKHRNGLFYLALADVYKRLKDAKETYRNYHFALNQKGNTLPEAHYHLGRFYLAQGNKEGFVDNMKKAIEEDPHFAPAYYELYAYYYKFDTKRSKEYFMGYKEQTDFTPALEFEEVSIYYATRDYADAIEKAKALLIKNPEGRDLRCYRLIGYSYHKLEHLDSAKMYLDSFFALTSLEDPNLVQAANYREMGDILSQINPEDDRAILFYRESYETDTSLAAKIGIARQIIALKKQIKDYKSASEWTGRLYQIKPQKSKNDLFNWGIETLRAKDYATADSIFQLYIQNYPEEYYGYFYSARSKAAMDTTYVTVFPILEKTIERAAVTNAADGEKELKSKKNVLLKSYRMLYDATIQWYQNAVSDLDALETNEKIVQIEKATAFLRQSNDYLDKIIQTDSENPKNEEYIKEKEDTSERIDSLEKYAQSLLDYERKKARKKKQ